MHGMTRFKIYFTQAVQGIEHCEAVVEAESSVEALEKFRERDFTIYLCTKADLDRVTDEDSVDNIELIN